jgi:hypothetical protein
MSYKKINTIVRNDDFGNAPLLVAFPQGVPDDTDDMQVIYGQKGEDRKRKQIVSADLNGMKYKGNDYQGENAKKFDSCKFAIGVLPEGSKDMMIYRADHIFVMKPQFANAAVPIRNTSMSNAERKQSLTEEFGSKKKKRALKAAQSNTISSENISGAAAVESSMGNQLDENDANFALVNAAEEALEKNRSFLLPQYNKDAKRPEDAYPVASLINRNLSNHLEEQYKAIFSEIQQTSGINKAKMDISSWVQRLDSEMPSSLVRLSLNNLPSAESTSSDNVKKQYSAPVSKILLLHQMLRFYLKINSGYDKIVSREEVVKHFCGSTQIVDYFADSFCVVVFSKGKPALSSSKANT